MKWFSRLVNQCILKREKQAADERKALVLDQTEDLDKARFDRAVSSVNALAMGAENRMQIAAVYDLAIWAIGRSVAADGCSAIMLGKYVADNHDISYETFPFLKEARLGKSVIDLSKCNAYTGCWSYDRVASTVASLFEFGYVQPSSSNGIYYPEIRLAVMLNGRHHTTWGTYLRDCNVNLDVISLAPYFDLVRTDGAFYDFENQCHEPQHIRVQDYRMAVLFQLAKIRRELDIPNTEDAYKGRTQTDGEDDCTSKEAQQCIATE